MNYVRVVPRRITHDDEGGELTYHAADKLAVGSVVKVPLGKVASTGVVTAIERHRPAFKTKLAEPLPFEPLPVALVETLVWLSRYYAVPLPLVINNALPPGLTKQRRPGPLKTETIVRPMAGFKLSQAQTAAAEAVRRADSTVILHGDTGSGKTLVYRQAAKAVLAAGRSVLILVPEIGLTPQAAGDYADLAEHIYVTHSRLTDSQRHGIWLDILQRSSPKIVIGPRSASMAADTSPTRTPSLSASIPSYSARSVPSSRRLLSSGRPSLGPTTMVKAASVIMPL